MTNFIQRAEDKLFKHKPMEEKTDQPETKEPVKETPKVEEVETPVVEETPVEEETPVAADPALNCAECKGTGLNTAQTSRCTVCHGTGRIN